MKDYLEALNMYKAVLVELEKALAGDDFRSKVYWAKQENKTLHKFPILKGDTNGGRGVEAYKAFREFMDRGNNKENLHEAFCKAVEDWRNDCKE